MSEDEDLSSNKKQASSTTSVSDDIAKFLNESDDNDSIGNDNDNGSSDGHDYRYSGFDGTYVRDQHSTLSADGDAPQPAGTTAAPSLMKRRRKSSSGSNASNNSVDHYLDTMMHVEEATTASTVSSGNHPRRPRQYKFRQQRLPAWQNALSPRTTLLAYFITGVALLAIGAAILIASDESPQVDARYDDKQSCPSYERLLAFGYACAPVRIRLDVRKKMKAPVFMYYELTGFYQNDWQWSVKKSENQLTNHHPRAAIGDCVPFEHPGQYIPFNPTVPSTVYYEGNTTASLPEAVYWPCGQMAWANFNDTFMLFKGDSSEDVDKVVHNKTENPLHNKALTLICDGGAFDKNGNLLDPLKNQSCRKKRIAWDSDPGIRFTSPIQNASYFTHEGWIGSCPRSRLGNPYSHYACNGWYIGEVGHQVPSPEDEDLMVWMRISPHSKFRKLYRVIEEDLDTGTYMLEVYQRYDTTPFGGKKSFIMTREAWTPRNYTLGAIYLVLGCITVIFGLGLLMKHLTVEGVLE